MTEPVLVPAVGRELFATRPEPGVDPVGYHVRPERLVRRALRHAGWLSPDQSLRARLEIEDDGPRASAAIALWLAPGPYLPPAQLRSLLDRLPRLRWVYSQITGVEHLDLAEFQRRGILVSNNGTLSSRRVAEMALACILAHAKRLPRHFDMQRARRWRSLGSQDLNRQTVGIVGTGAIGTELASMCRALGMHVIGASRQPDRFGSDPSPFHRVLDLRGELKTLLGESDHVVLALPLNDATRGAIDAAALAQMRPSAALINVSRGPLVDEDALCDALARGSVAAAYIDRPSTLPPPRWSRLYRTPNLVLTHYSAAASPHATAEAFGQFVAGLRTLLTTGVPADLVTH
ncbi:MAG TPA: NAD(P)-dependent oxidoreductase [Methylomirabilota bacterium]|nr:NAD(P)-dependent oxidoreductase [Methylomirabilota bacterium]